MHSIQLPWGDDMVAIQISIGFVLAVFVLSGIKIVNEYDRGVRFTLGRYSGLMSPGMRFVIPLLQSWRRIDMRTIVVDVPDQDAITKDNVTIKVNAVLYFRVQKANDAVIKVQNFDFAVSQLAQTTMRDVVGEVTLDELLSNRDQISKSIRDIVDKQSDPWGLKVESVELKHIELPGEMVRVMAKQAEAERERRAVIIKADGELKASVNLSKAAITLSKAPGALHLRTLHSLNDISSDRSNTVVFTIPLEILRAFGKT